MPERVLCLSVKQPWAELLVRGLKTIEVRTWWPRLQLPVLVAIHAGKRLAPDAPVAQPDVWHMAFGMQRHTCETSLRNGGTVAHRLGGIVGVARFVGRRDFGAGHTYTNPRQGHLQFERLARQHLCPLHWWHSEMVGFEFDQPRAFAKIIPCRGQLRLYRLDAETERRVRAAMEVAR